MEITITGTAKEIAALVAALQERQPVTLDGAKIAEAIRDRTPAARPLAGVL